MYMFGKASKIKLSVLVIVMLLVALLSPGPAFAAATTFTSSQNFPIDLFVYVTCAAGGAGEFVELTGNLHDLFSVTLDSGGGVHVSLLDNPQGVSGYGMITGAKYQATGETRDGFNSVVGFEETYVNNFKIIGQGPGNNFLIHENFHITVNPDGTVTSYHDNYSVECK